MGRRTKDSARRFSAINGTLQPGICHHWQLATGDAGWAGVLAESANARAKGLATVIYKPGMEILALVNEAMSLLPRRRRWDISFSTYYTKLPPGVDCVWRFVLQGSPEAQVASRFPGATVTVLCWPLGRAVGGPLVEAARTGQLPAPPEKPALVQAAVEASKQSVSVKAESTGKGRRDATGIRPVVPLQLVAENTA